MRFNATVFLIIGASVVVKSALSTTSVPVTSDPVPSAPVGPSACGSKWTDFTSFIGEEMLMNAKEQLMNKPTSCLNLTSPPEWGPIHIKCFVNSMKITQQQLSERETKTPTTKDWKRWFENSVACLIQEINITTTDTGYDRDSFKKMPVEDWASKAEEKIAVRTIVNSCVDSSTGATAVQQLISYLRCFVGNVTSLCTERDESAGINTIMKAFLTLWDDSACSGVQIPHKFDDTITFCMARTEKEWTDAGLAKFTSTSMMKYNNSDVKNAMYFLKMYAKDFLMELVECGAEEMEFYNETTGMFNFTAGEDFLTNLEGWNDSSVKDSVVMAFKGCEVTQNETTLMKMNEMEREMSVLKTIMKFKTCFMSKFVDICGLNNDLASVFFPIMNNKLIGSIGKDFNEKKGALAIMHIVPALQEKFQQFFSFLNANMMTST